MPKLLKTYVSKTLKLLRQAPYFALGLILTCIVGCSTMPKTFTISEGELQKKLAEHIAIPISLLKIFDVSLSNPIIKLDAGSERLFAHVDTKVSNPFSKQPLLGKIDISGKLRFDAEKSAIVLVDAKLENLNIDSLSFDKKSNEYTEIIQILSSKLGQELLNNLVLYKVKPEDLVVGNTHYMLKDIKVVKDALQITLLPQ